jgi:hypothetical protein
MGRLLDLVSAAEALAAALTPGISCPSNHLRHFVHEDFVIWGYFLR